MKIALTVWENRISPVLDSACRLLIVEIEKGMVITKHYALLNSQLPPVRAEKLAELEIDVLICGAVSQPLANLIEASGIQIISFVKGNVKQVLDGYLKDHLSTPQIRMPRYSSRRHIKNILR